MTEYQSRQLSALERIAVSLELLVTIDLPPIALGGTSVDETPASTQTQPEPPKVAEITADSLKALCLELFAEDNANKAIIKSYLLEFGANRIASLTQSQVETVHARVTSLRAVYE